MDQDTPGQGGSQELTEGERARAHALLALEPPRAMHGPFDFDDPTHEWRRLFSELLGTFFLVLVGAGGAVVNAQSDGAISRTAAVTAPGPHGDGDHPLHGRRLGRAPQPRRQHRLRGPRRLPLAPRARLHHRPAARRDPRLPLPLGAPRQARHARGHRARARDQRDPGDVHGAGPHRRPRQHHPRHRLGRPERRASSAPSASAATSSSPASGRARSAAPR